MSSKHESIVQPSPMPYGWFSELAPWIIAGVVCAGYLFTFVTTQPLPLFSLLLLTGVYGAWLVIFQFGPWRSESRSRSYWLLALFCLGCLSQFIPLPARPYLLPLLPIITTGLMTMIKPRLLSLGLSCTLWLSSYLAFSRFGGIDNQMPLFLTFLATYSYWALIHRIVASRIALAIVHTELTAAHRQLQEYSAQVEKLSAIDERNRIARDIHDTLGHALTLLSVQLETAVQFESCGDLRLHEKLLQARQVARTCLTDIRHAIEALRPDEASTGTLQDQLRRLVEEFEMAGCQTQIALDVEEVTHSLNPDLCQTLYRCAQEALTNIRKHAQATRVLLRLSTNEEQVELTVLDNGQGSAPSPEQSASGFGLRGMRERVALLDGRLSAGPASELGWRVEVVLPLISPERTKGSVLGVHQTKQEV